MLTNTMTNKLNNQINLEFFSANLYLQMSAWAKQHGFPGAAKFLNGHAQEEQGHMNKLFHYVSETGAMPILGAIDAPDSEFESLEKVFRLIFEHEKLITKKINELVHEALSTQDYSTFQFLQWYVAEQHEEEKLFQGILDKFELMGNDPRSLFLIDKDLCCLVKNS